MDLRSGAFDEAIEAPHEVAQLAGCGNLEALKTLPLHDATDLVARGPKRFDLHAQQDVEQRHEQEDRQCDGREERQLVQAEAEGRVPVAETHESLQLTVVEQRGVKFNDAVAAAGQCMRLLADPGSGFRWHAGGRHEQAIRGDLVQRQASTVDDTEVGEVVGACSMAEDIQDALLFAAGSQLLKRDAGKHAHQADALVARIGQCVLMLLLEHEITDGRDRRQRRDHDNQSNSIRLQHSLTLFCTRILSPCVENGEGNAPERQ